MQALAKERERPQTKARQQFEPSALPRARPRFTSISSGCSPSSPDPHPGGRPNRPPARQDPNGGPPRTAYEQSALTFTTSAVNSPLLLTVW